MNTVFHISGAWLCIINLSVFCVGMVVGLAIEYAQGRGKR